MTKRNYGIDLLRIVAMFMIVLNHSLLMGGVIGQATKIGVGSVNYNLSWILDIICYGAVNCYALISGYVGVKAKFRPANLIRLWLQVLFYSVILNIAVVIVVPGVGLSKSDIVQMFLPVSYQRYWYFSAYFVMFLFIPILNYILNNLNKATLQKFILMLIVIFSFAETFIFRIKAFMSLESGYSVLWLTVLYLIGGYINLYGWRLWQRNLLVFSVSVILSFAVLLLLGGEDNHGRLLINYPAPTILFMAIALLNYFKDLQLTSNKIKLVKFFAPLTFGVYLIHIQPMVAKYLLQGSFSFLAIESPWKMVVLVVITSVAIYLVCSIIEWLRLLLFNMFHLDGSAKKISDVLVRLCQSGAMKL